MQVKQCFAMQRPIVSMYSLENGAGLLTQPRMRMLTHLPMRLPLMKALQQGCHLCSKWNGSLPCVPEPWIFCNLAKLFTSKTVLFSVMPQTPFWCWYKSKLESIRTDSVHLALWRCAASSMPRFLLWVFRLHWWWGSHASICRIWTCWCIPLMREDRKSLVAARSSIAVERCSRRMAGCGIPQCKISRFIHWTRQTATVFGGYCSVGKSGSLGVKRFD